MTLETGVAFLVAFLAALIVGPFVIARMHVLKFGQNINSYVEGHAKKQGTPTMGGIIIAIGLTVGVLAAVGVDRLRSAGTALDSEHLRALGPVAAVCFAFIGNMIVGFLDDYLSIKRGKNLGLSQWQKLGAQFIVAAGFTFWLATYGHTAQTTIISFGRSASMDVDFGWFYYVISVLLIMGMSNATNFTDGLDGLLGGTSVLAALGLSATVYIYGINFGLPWFGFAIAGACVGFLWYNANPAKIFMGDTGSLAIGAGFAAMALIGKQEILVLLFCIVFIVEMFSVIAQVGGFKVSRLYRRKVLKQPNAEGRRIFRMAPLHHHFEKLGVAETAVVARFWIAGTIALVVGLMIYPFLSPFISFVH